LIAKIAGRIFGFCPLCCVAREAEQPCEFQFACRGLDGNRLKEWARGIKRALYLASHDPRVPWYAKALGTAVAAAAADMNSAGRKAAAVIVSGWIGSAVPVGWLVYRWLALDSADHLR
jgi:hypothetical protein